MTNTGNVATVIDVSGNPLICSPDFTASATVDYAKPIDAAMAGATATVYLTDRFAYTFEQPRAAAVLRVV